MVNKIKKVLVVGGAGYVGGGVTDILLKRKIPFTVYDALLYEHQYLKPVDFIFGDVRNHRKLAKILSHYSHVIWLAAIVGDKACRAKRSLTESVNQHSVEWLSKNFNGRIIYPSTCSVYGINVEMVNEDAPLNPLSYYAQTKLKAEKYLKGKNHLIFRLGTAYGISDMYSRIRLDLVLNYMTAKAIVEGQLNIFGGTQWRPMIYVNDIAEVIVNNLESSAHGIYNLATINLQIKDLAKIIQNLTNCKMKYTKQKFEDHSDYHISMEKITKDGFLKLEKIHDIEYGIKEIINLIKLGRLKCIENDIHYNEKHIPNLLKNGELI